MKYIKKPCQLSHLFKLNEMGRSMVEMLGVLAVIGVLSIAGIVGFRYAMTKYAANETISEINFRATDLSFQMQQGATEVVMNMDETTRMGYPISARVSPSDGNYFEIFVKDVPSDVCRELLRMPWRAPYSIFVGTEEFEASEEICNQAKTVELAYEFYRDLSSKEDIPEDEQHQITRCRNDNECKCGECESGICQSYCGSDEQCAQNYDQGSYWMCCPNSNVLEGICCTSVDSAGNCCNSKEECCPAAKPLRDKNGICFSCNESKNVDVNGYLKNCEICPKRYVTGGVEERNLCSLCGVVGTDVADKPIVSDYGGACYSCDSPDKMRQIGIKTPYLCENVCDNRRFISSRCMLACPPETPIMDANGDCHACDYEGKAYVGMQNKTCTEICSDRKDDGGYCVLSDCPDTKPLRDTYGVCHACNELDNVNVHGRTENCQVCPNRYVTGGVEGRNLCSLCGVAGTDVADKPIVSDYGGACYSCDSSDKMRQIGIKTPYLCENVCDNRRFISSRCMPPCPPEKPLMDADGDCHTCDYEGKAYVGIRNKTCTELCSDRKDDSGYCVLSDCPDTKPLRDKYGVCHACNELDNVNVHGRTENCKVCPNRYVTGGVEGRNLCSLCGVAGTDVADKPIVSDYGGECYSCTEGRTIRQIGIYDSYQCDNVCENRKYINGVCSFKCTEAEPLLNSGLMCQSCNYTGNDVPTKYLEKSCEELCPNRIEVGDQCEWNGECLSGYFLSKNNVCFACNSPMEVEVDPMAEECGRCLNRTLFGNLCLLTAL